jgi:hypothetical protein
MPNTLANTVFKREQKTEPDTLSGATRGPKKPATLGANLPASSIPFFGGSPSEMATWNAIDMGGVPFENTKIEISGTPTVKWDVKPTPATDGASMHDQGYVPAHVSISVLIWNRSLFLSLQDLIKVAKVKPGKTRSVPIDILHPHLELYGLRRFVIEGTPLLRDAGPQMKTATFTCIEYFAQPKKHAAKETAGVANHPTIFDSPAKSGGKLKKPSTSQGDP